MLLDDLQLNLWLQWHSVFAGRPPSGLSRAGGVGLLLHWCSRGSRGQPTVTRHWWITRTNLIARVHSGVSVSARAASAGCPFQAILLSSLSSPGIPGAPHRQNV